MVAAFSILEKMQKEGTKPHWTTFSAIQGITISSCLSTKTPPHLYHPYRWLHPAPDAERRDNIAQCAKAAVWGKLSPSNTVVHW